MDFNIKQKNFENHVFGPRSIINESHKSFKERSIKRFKNKNIPINDDDKNVKHFKIKKNYKTYDDEEVLDNEAMKTNHVRLNVENLSSKSFNTDKCLHNVAYDGERKSVLTAKLNDYKTNTNSESKLNSFKSKDKFGDYKQRVFKSQEPRNDVKEKNFYRIDKSYGKIKWNFLQESQLNKDKPVGIKESTTNPTNSKRPSNNGLNPAAIEFTPNSTLPSAGLAMLEASKTIHQITDIIENGFKTLSFNNETVNTISNPVVIDTTDYSYTNPQLSLIQEQAYSGKFGLMDPSSLVQNMYQYRPLSRMNYPAPQNIVPQFRFLYGSNPQLVRYNPTQNIPVNFQGNYFVYNPMMFNGMYNSTSPLVTNRLVSLGAADIPMGNLSTNLAHSFNPNVNPGNYPSFYYADSMNNGPPHIR